jgi:sugar lactone lactonase YvrE
MFILAALFLIGSVPRPVPKGKLAVVFSDPDFQLTGVTVSKSGRMFVNYPRWSDRYRFAVGEITMGKVTAYPDQTWNTRDGKEEGAAQHFVCVQSVVVDDTDTLWVVTAAAPLMGPVVQGGAKIVGIDLRHNRVSKVIAFPADVVGLNGYLNDIRVDTKLNTAYLTDSGAGGLIVGDLNTSLATRRLAGDPSVLAQKGTSITIDGKPVVGSDGKTPEIHSDRIALWSDGVFLYYQALTSSRLYRVKTAALRAAGDTILPEKIADTFPADGLWMDREGKLYLTNLNDKAVFRRDSSGALTRLFSDPRLEWPDTFTAGPDGTLYVTASHINESPRFNQGKSIRTEPYTVFRFRP